MCVQSYDAAGNVQYTYAQLEGLWNQAGGNQQAANIAAAIAMAESGGNSTATCVDSNGSVDRGLWQINSVHGSQSTYDPMGNARAAISISNNGANFSAWTTYTSGAYQRFMTNAPPDTSAPINATNAAANQPAGNTQATDQSLICDAAPLLCAVWNSPLGGASSALGGSNLLDPISGWLNPMTVVNGVVGMYVNPLLQIGAGLMGIGAGALIMGLGIFTLVRQTQAGQAATQAGMMAIAPEAAATTEYMGAAGQTTVTQRRRQAVNVGGYQARPARVRTTVQYPEGSPQAQRQQQGPRPRVENTVNTDESLRREANEYSNRNRGRRAA